MKTAFKFCLFLGLLSSINFALANDQVDPIKGSMMSFGDNEEQIDQQVKPGADNHATMSDFREKKAVTYKKEDKVSEKCVNSFSYIILNSLPADFMDTKKQSFFILPFSFSMK